MTHQQPYWASSPQYRSSPAVLHSRGWVTPWVQPVDSLYVMTRELTPLCAGEANITRGCARTGIIQMVSSNASLSFAQIAEARVSPDQPLFFQLYKHRDDKIAEQRVREVISLGYSAIFLTVDAICAGNRERDIRAPFELEQQEREANKADQPTDAPAQPEDGENVNLLGTAGALIANDDLDMTWKKTIPWLRSITKLPIVIKGVQCVQVGART